MSEDEKSQAAEELPEDIRSAIATIDSSTLLTWAVMLLAFLAGMLAVFPEIKPNAPLLSENIALSVIYVGLALGFAFSVTRVGLFMWRVRLWYHHLEGKYGDFRMEGRGILGTALFTVDGRLRSSVLSAVALASFVLWTVLLLLKLFVGP